MSECKRLLRVAGPSDSLASQFSNDLYFQMLRVPFLRAEKQATKKMLAKKSFLAGAPLEKNSSKSRRNATDVVEM